MAKRFTDSTKWNDNWFFNLKNEEKLAWIYILDTCDHAGIWEKNLRLLNFQIGSTFVEDDFNLIFKGKFIEINNKWFIPNFIKFQYGKTFLTSNTPAVKSARDLLLDLGFIQQDDKGSLTLIKELPNPYLTLKDKDKDKDEDKSIDKVKNEEQDKDEVIDKLKRKYELTDKLKDVFKDIPNIIKMIDNDEMDSILRKDKSLFNKYYETIMEYKSISI
jgi:hypothetical protein